MERRSEVQDRRAGRHLRDDGFVVVRVASGLPPVAPGKTRVAPLSAVKSIRAITEANCNSGLGSGTRFHTISSWCQN